MLRMARSRRLVAACALATACDPSGKSAPAPPAEVAFPAAFLWGTSTSGFQVEEGDVNTDWSHWVAVQGKIVNGDSPDVGGPNALGHIADDVAAMKGLGMNAYRFSIEWGRVYPTRAAFDADMPDPQALAAYGSLLQALGAAGIRPMVTLVHFALPDWLSDGVPATQAQPQGWERPETQALFTQWCSRAAARWGSAVDWWLTMNEPLPLALGGYVQGSFPPGVLLDVQRALGVTKAEARAHAACFDAIHAADTIDADGDGKAALVSSANHQRTFHPYDATDPMDQAAAQRVEYVWNQWFLNAIVKGNWDDDFDGAYSSPGDILGDPSLVRRADFVGINYYSDTLVSASTGIVLPIIKAAVFADHLPTGRPRSDVAWDIYPEGFGAVLDEAATYGLPMVVTENGLADAADDNRARFLLEHLYQLGWAMQRGDAVVGYFHWALIDNFEWARGFCPRFGLVSYDPASGTRTVKASAATYQSIVAARRVTRASVDGAPQYVMPQECN
jgi:beta-glucosidase/6-phospho-beta-glucosidase/beta-galactosidase